MAADPRDPQSRDQSDPPGVSPHHFDRHQRLALSSRLLVRETARRRVAGGRLSARLADRELRRRHDAARGDRQAPDLQRDVGPDPGAGGRSSAVGRAEHHRGRHGGTTFDVSAIRNRQIVVSPESTFGMEMLGIPKIDVRSVGAGGGSIASIDAGGLLKVGPRSASAYPGPACYGRGGNLPTVTDANLVLGIIDPDYFLGGRMKLDREKAEQVIGTLAQQLRVDLLSAAWAIYTTINHNMIAAIEDVTVNEGIDPRESYMISGGGATACHIGDMCRVVGIRSFMVPKLAAGLSAYGGLLSDIRWEETATLRTSSRKFDAAGVDRLLLELKLRGDRFLERAGVAPAARSFSYAFQGRYLFQSWDIEVTFELSESGMMPADLPRLAAAFHAQHEAIYTIKDVVEVVEFTTWKVRAIGDTGGRLRHDAVLPAQASRVSPTSQREVYLGGNRQRLPVYNGSILGSGAVIAGPAIVEETTTTMLLLQDQLATTDHYGNYLVESRS